jgi:hypothetical protein
MIADSDKIAATAQANAATAQQVAAVARDAADKAAEWAAEAKASSDQADIYAQEAEGYAQAAETSAQEAAASAATARAAAASANTAARNAARSAADATVSAEVAQAEATSAWVAAEQARQSAEAAGKSADEALALATETFEIAVKKYREEEEARRKAALAEKAANEDELTPAELYRCGHGAIIMPCEEPERARWCQHNWIECEAWHDVRELGDALGQANGVIKELSGLGQYDDCLRKKDFDSCSGLAFEALLGARLKALEKAFEGLSLLRRGCTNCFPAGTGVLMGDGSRKDIEDVRPGDRVLATDPVSGRTAVQEVTRRIVTQDDKRFNELTLATPAGAERVTATDRHPFWSPSQRGWVDADALAPGMSLLTDDGTTVEVSANRAFIDSAPTYNLTVDGLHTFYVFAGTTPVLVHNSTCSHLFSGDGLQHALYNHVYGSPGANADPDKMLFHHTWKKGQEVDEVADLIMEVLDADPTGVANWPAADGSPRDGTRHLLDFGYTVGYKDKDGSLLKSYCIEVILHPDGSLRTAYPVDPNRRKDPRDVLCDPREEED